MIRLISIGAISTLFLLVIGACRPHNEPLHACPDPPVINSVKLKPLPRGAMRNNHRNFALLIRMNVLTIRLPIGAVSNSEAIWNYLDEEPVGARISSTLAMNGIRVGVGRKGDWDQIVRILRRHTAQPLTRSVALGPSGRSMPIIFKPHQQVQTIFTYRQDITLFGRDYPPGDNVLMTAASLNYDNLDMINVSAALVIRSAHRRRQYVRQAGKYGFVSKPIYYQLDGLEFQVRVPRGGFILIGPGRDIRRPSSVGHHFLVCTDRGVDFETVVVLAPEVFAAPLGGSQ